MKKALLAFFVIVGLALSQPAVAQFYTLSGGEMIFSWADVSIDGSSVESRLRWSPVFNFGWYTNYDINDRVGFYSGIDVKNIGFIFQDPNNNNYKVIQRTYNLGIPVAVKVGDLKKFFFYGGYQLEIPFLYKHKSWTSTNRSGDKTKITEWFSDATPGVMHTFFAGIQFYGGMNIKFRYYLDNFVNPDHMHNGALLNPNTEVQVYSISLAASLFKGTKFYPMSE